MARLVAIVILGAGIIISPARARADCAGDCNGNGQVTLVELRLLVHLGLRGVLTSCQAGDLDQSRRITVEEIVRAVHATEDCVPPEPTPMPTSTPTASPTPSPTASHTPDEFIAEASDFDGLATWPQVRRYRLTNKRGQLEEALAVAIALGETADLRLPTGTIVQLFAGEAMVKRGGDFEPEHHGWEYFVLGSSGGRIQILSRGGIAASQGRCYGCHAAARSFDYLCEGTHGCGF